jgi:hypothetical protein
MIGSIAFLLRHSSPPKGEASWVERNGALSCQVSVESWSLYPLRRWIMRHDVARTSKPKPLSI